MFEEEAMDRAVHINRLAHLGSNLGLLALWLPLGLGIVACGVGVVALSRGREVSPAASRRALIALILSAVPGSLCTLCYLAFSV
jgi:hypothetical protein